MPPITFLMTFTWLKISIFIFFYESMTNGRTDRQTEGPTDRERCKNLEMPIFIVFGKA